MSKQKGLVIYLKPDESVYVIVGGEAIAIRLLTTKAGSCRLLFDADRNKVKIYREKYLRRTHEEAHNRLRGVHRKQPDKKDSEGE